MKVYFDVSSLNPNRITGIGVYTMDLFRHLKSTPEVTVVPVLKLSRLRKKATLEKFLGTSIELIFPWTGIFQKDALYHGPDFKVQMWPHLPRLVTIHDMIVFEKKFNHPKFYQRGIRALTKLLNSDLAAILVNSEFTRNEVLKYFPQLINRIHVTTLGCKRRTETNLPNNFGSYLLFLGTVETRKNILGLLQAFEILRNQGLDQKLVLAGSLGFGGDEILKRIEISPHRKEIILLNYVSDEDAIALYKHALAFVFPSWYEGFGIPVLEAMQAGCPVVTSKGGVLEEITDGAALLCDPSNPMDIAEQIKQLLLNQTLRDNLITKGINQASRFSSESCLQKTLAVYNTALNGSRLSKLNSIET